MDGSEPKYLNSPESVLFKKSDSLYGLIVARKWMKDEDKALISEGYMDLLSMHQAGIKNSVATLGTALTVGHLRLIKRFTSNVVTVFDADAAGVKATLRALELFLAEGISGRVLSMPEGHDPDSFVKEVGGDRFRKELNEAKPLLEFLINYYLKGKINSDLQEKLKAMDKVFPYIGMISNRIERWHYVKLLSELTGIKEEVIGDELRKRVGGAARGVDVRLQKGSAPHETLRAEKNIVQLIIKHPELKNSVGLDIFSIFHDSSLRSIGEVLLKAPEGSDIPGFLELEEDKGVYRKLVIEMPEFVDPAKALEDSIGSLKSYRLKRDRQELRKRMEEAAQKGDYALLTELTERHRHLK